MELREAIGSRRSMRFLLPHRPVEMEKIQRMLEAARLASHWGNVQALKAIVVVKETAPKEVVDALFAPIAGYQIRIAPVVIVWFLDLSTVDEQNDRLRELLKVGAFGVGEKKQETLETRVIPIFDNILEGMKQPGVNEVDAGQGIAQATLVAFEQGLGTCLLGTPNTEQLRQNLGLPDHCRVLLLQTVGYPAESPDGGGQRPRQGFERLFHLNGYGKPFPRDEAVVEGLKQDRMLQESAPLPWREAELDYLQRALDIKGSGLI
jgi:nitroreductase